MAPTTTSTAYLTAGGAVAIGVVAAFFTPEGPWEPISAILGWTVPLLVALGLTWGRPAPVVAAAAVYVVRIGMHGIAGDRSPGLAVSAVMLVAMIELAAASWESRRLPLPLDAALARAVVLAAGAGVVVGLVAVGDPVAIGSGVAPALIGLAGAMAVAAILLRAARS